ncbi:MAG: SpoIIE family protein phosphatase, partial [Myxococcaceae bacterium]
DTQYLSKKFTFRPGDVVVWFTDGVTESESTQRVQYGSQRLSQCIRDNANLPAERLRDAILLNVRQHMGTQPQADDITIVVAEYAAAGVSA